MEQIWHITVDRFGTESVAKSGRAFSIYETGTMIIDKYKKQDPKPIIKIVVLGLGAALAIMLESRGIPVKHVSGALERIGSADVLKLKGA